VADVVENKVLAYLWYVWLPTDSAEEAIILNQLSHKVKIARQISAISNIGSLLFTAF
jgi:hypothetical protein